MELQIEDLQKKLNLTYGENRSLEVNHYKSSPFNSIKTSNHNYINQLKEMNAVYEGEIIKLKDEHNTHIRHLNENFDKERKMTKEAYDNMVNE